MLNTSTHDAALVIQPFGNPEVTPNPLLELIFSTYEAQYLGVIDYHGPDRNYNRERLGRIDLMLEASGQQRLKQHALYNYTNKYANLKAEMSLSDGTWIAKFRGRDILRMFAGELVRGMSYEYFRDLVITKMTDNNYRPAGMTRVVESILAD